MTGDTVQTGEAKGRAIAKLLAGSWHTAVPDSDLSETELALVTPLLYKTGAAALGWWKIRHTSLATSAAALQLQHAYRLQRLYAAIHEREIKYIFSLLRAAGIEPVLIKGWANARLYPDRGLRPYGDIDLCVPPDRFTQAATALKCLESLDGHCVDLHSGFGKDGDHPWEEVFERSRLLELSPSLNTESAADVKGGPVGVLTEGSDKLKSIGHKGVPPGPATRVRVLCPEDHLRLICRHLLRTDACRPLWLCDVAALLESRPADFDWQRCLGGDSRHADWIACTIGLAHQLLNVEISDTPVAERARRLPRWLLPALLRQWGRAAHQHAEGMAVPALLRALPEPRRLFREIYSRWDRPIRASVALHANFNNVPRLPYQLAMSFKHSRVLPGQLAMMLRARAREAAARS